MRPPEPPPVLLGLTALYLLATHSFGAQEPDQPKARPAAPKFVAASAATPAQTVPPPSAAKPRKYVTAAHGGSYDVQKAGAAPNGNALRPGLYEAVVFDRTRPCAWSALVGDGAMASGFVTGRGELLVPRAAERLKVTNCVLVSSG